MGHPSSASDFSPGVHVAVLIKLGWQRPRAGRLYFPARGQSTSQSALANMHLNRGRQSAERCPGRTDTLATFATCGDMAVRSRDDPPTPLPSPFACLTHVPDNRTTTRPTTDTVPASSTPLHADDLFPTWGTGDGTPMNGGGGGGVGDVIEFASSFWASSWRLAAGAGAFLDPDFLAVGCPTDRPCEAGTPRPRGPPLSDVEQRTQMTMWCVLGAPLIIGADVRNLSSMALATLSSKEAILVNQDPLVAQPRLISKRPLPAVGTQVWARHLANGDTAVAMVNMHPKATRTVEIDLRDIASCPSCHAPEFAWTNIWTGDTGKASSTFSASVAPHAAVFLRLKPQATQTV